MTPTSALVRVLGPDPKLAKAAGSAFYQALDGTTILSASGSNNTLWLIPYTMCPGSERLQAWFYLSIPMGQLHCLLFVRLHHFSLSSEVLPRAT